MPERFLHVSRRLAGDRVKKRIDPIVTPTTGINWGAYIDGDPTYRYYYGGTWGDAPWDSATWNLFEQHTGKKVSICHFGQPPPWEQAFAASPLTLCWDRGAIPMVDMQPKTSTLAQITSGTRDADFTTWATAVAAWGKPMFLRWAWEMNGTWYNYGLEAQADPAVYVSAWQRIRNVCDAAGATNISWLWCPNLVFTGSTSLASLYPGDAYVDWTGLDGYNQGTTSLSFQSLYQVSYNELVAIAPSKPIMVGETSSYEYSDGYPSGKAAWTTAALASLPVSFPKIRGFCWFNWRILDGSVYRDWPIESSASAQQAFASGISSTYFKAGPLPAPVFGKVVVP